MSAFEMFFQSVRTAFSPRPGFSLRVALLLAILGLLVLWQVILARRRARAAEEQAYRRAIAGRQMSSDDDQLLRKVAAHAGVGPTIAAGHRDAFERGTALELRTNGAPLARQEGDVFDRVRRLRRALRFDTVPDHSPLLTTRELRESTDLELAGAPAAVASVDEAFFWWRAGHLSRVESARRCRSRW